MYGDKKQSMYYSDILKIDMDLFDYPIPEIKVEIPAWGRHEEFASVRAVAQVPENDRSYKQSHTLWKWDEIETIEDLELAKKEAQVFVDEFKKDRKGNWKTLFTEGLEKAITQKENDLKTHNKRVRKELEETAKMLQGVK